ncbi:type II toxin-antitoxin system PemK/MazF family toxin [Petrimonas sp.]|uniref:type II toxin-antitoxin system PemK/MazF family toxin n=1 Tax=Petrimonas sp. TaxID=2023866 RepID=UPI003F514AEB
MKYKQRDVVEINFLFPNGAFKPHPAIIVSNDELQEDENFMYFVLISSKPGNSRYSFPLTNEMLTFEMAKQSYVKTQLIVGNTERDVIRRLGRIKSEYFSEIQTKIIDSIF